MPIVEGPSPFNEDGTQYAWDSTSIKLAETCLRKYYLKLQAGWQPYRKSAHLIFGGIYAKALEDYHKSIALGIDREQAIRDVVHMALIETWDYETVPEDHRTGTRCYDPEGCDDPDCVDFVYYQGMEPGDPIEGTGAPWQSDHNLKTRGNLIRSIVWYFEQFRDDPCTTVILSTGAPAVEHSFKLPVDDGIVFSGHLDRLVTYSGSLYVQDQKSTGTTITSRFFDQFSPDTQMSMYTLAGKMIFDMPVKGVMIDAVQVAVGFSRYERGFTFRSADQLTEWYDDTMLTIRKANEATVAGHWPMNPSACGNYGGCEFRNICSRAPSVREQFLKGDFTIGPIWNPLKNRE